MNSSDSSDRIFTVSFLPRQDNSTEYVIQIANDDIFEGTESFHLRIHAIRFIGDTADIFRPQIVEATFAEVIIQDDDSEFRNSAGCSFLCICV